MPERKLRKKGTAVLFAAVPCQLCSSQEDLAAAAADHLMLPPAHGDGLQRLTGRAAENALAGAVAKAIADALLSIQPEIPKAPPHFASHVSCLRASRKMSVK